MSRLSMIMLLLLAVCISLPAQKVRNVSGEYVYYAPENISLEQAKATALERARIDAIAKEFGANVSQTNTVSALMNNGDSETFFQSIGGTEINGDWLSDSKEPQITIAYEDGMLVISAKVWGKARERTRATFDLEIQTLCNGIESDRFKNQDIFSVRFRSAIKGFFSIWLADDNIRQVYCLLPYENTGGQAREIQGQKEYTFLSTTDAQYPYLEETILTAEKEIEYNRLVFIFSTAPFIMPLTQQGEFLPELPVGDFNKWLQRNRIKDENMLVIERIIAIKK